MSRFISFLAVISLLPVVLLDDAAIPSCHALSSPVPVVKSRRAVLRDCCRGFSAASASFLLVLPIEAVQAKEDCIKDCMANCKLIAPKDTSGYCQENCIDYCAQPDRTGEY
jgi:hypothetical protein